MRKCNNVKHRQAVCLKFVGRLLCEVFVRSENKYLSIKKIHFYIVVSFAKIIAIIIII